MYQARSLTIGELLENGAFRLPSFQRPYAWEYETAVQLFDDIYAAMQANEVHTAKFDNYEPYFLGPIIVVPNGQAQPSDLVDGQQRLVTLTSLLAILRDKSADEGFRDYLNTFIWRPPNPLHGTPPTPRLRIRALDQDRFNALVQKSGGTIDLPTTADTAADERLLMALMSLKQEIGNVTESHLHSIARFVLEKCVVLQISAPTLSTGYRVFRGINSRGQQLEPLDLVRAELLGTPHDDGVAIASAWGEAEDVLGPDELQGYVEAVVQSVAPQQWDGDLARAFRLVMSDPRLSVTLHKRMREFLNAHTAIEGGELEFGVDTPLINRRLTCIRHLPFDDWRAPLLLFMTQGPSSRELYRFLIRLEAVALTLHISGAPKSTIRKRFASCTKWLSESNDPFAQSAPFTVKHAELGQAIAKFDANLKPLPKFAKHLLLRLNVEMCTDQIAPYFPSDLTIEHILPQNPKGVWLETFPNAAERSAWTHRMGNLALLTHSINARAKNHPFEQKKSAIFGTENGNVFAITAHLAALKTWDMASLKSRHQKLLNLTKSLLNVQ